MISQTYYLMEPYILENEELNELVVKIPGWEIKSKQIQREFNLSLIHI